MFSTDCFTCPFSTILEDLCYDDILGCDLDCSNCPFKSLVEDEV